jgi:hypothetical protein
MLRDGIQIRRFLLALIFVSAACAARAEDYYIDSQSGNDAHAGVSSGLAWRSLAHVNHTVFQPGDRILFKAGTCYSGQLAPQGLGAPNRPIFLGSYGAGAAPRIDGEGRVADTLLLSNVAFWEVSGLEITNLGPDRAPWRTGVRVVTKDFGVMRHIHLQNLFVHDVNGDLRKDHEGCGILFESLGKASCFDDLLVEHCHVVRTDRNGICQRNGSDVHSVHVVIRGNLLEDIGGDGIKVWGSDGPLVEDNVLRGARMRCEDAAAGIWPFDCNDALIQHNEVSGMRGTLDGEGFDSDYLCRRSVFQYNYSHDNDGGFMLVCSPGNSFNTGTVIRYNISQRDGIHAARVFHFGGGSSDTLVCNNTIYIGAGQDVPLFLFGEWSGGHARGAKFLNNIFYVDGQVSYRWDSETGTVFAHNVFYGLHGSIPPDRFAVRERPALVRPGSGAEGFGSLGGYEPVRGADFPRGQVIPGNGGRDFFGRVVPEDQAPYVGAAEGD